MQLTVGAAHILERGGWEKGLPRDWGENNHPKKLNQGLTVVPTACFHGTPSDWPKRRRVRAGGGHQQDYGAGIAHAAQTGSECGDHASTAALLVATRK